MYVGRRCHVYWALVSCINDVTDVESIDEKTACPLQSTTLLATFDHAGRKETVPMLSVPIVYKTQALGSVNVSINLKMIEYGVGM